MCISRNCCLGTVAMTATARQGTSTRNLRGGSKGDWITKRMLCQGQLGSNRVSEWVDSHRDCQQSWFVAWLQLLCTAIAKQRDVAYCREFSITMAIEVCHSFQKTSYPLYITAKYTVGCLVLDDLKAIHRHKHRHWTPQRNAQQNTCAIAG